MPRLFRSAAVVATGPLVAVLLGPASAFAQTHPLTWSLAVTPLSAPVGRRLTARLHVQIPGGWHLYSLTQPPGGPVPTVIGVAAGSPFRILGTPSSREADVAPDNNFQIVTETFTDSVTFVVPVTAIQAGVDTLALDVAYETCTDRYCLPPTHDVLRASLRALPSTGASGRVSSPPPTATPPAVTAPARPADPPVIAPHISGPAGTTTASFPLFLWLAAVMGALSLLTPCVFPMIPITVSYFTHARETARGSPARNAAVYAAGIMATFTVLGMAVATLVGAGGINRFASNPWINLLVTGIFIAFTLNLFGIYQVSVPGALLTRLDRATRRTGGNETLGILVMGLVFTLTSFTCTVPFVGTLLVMAAQGSWVWPVTGLLVFSAVFSLPFFLLALVPGAAARLPRAGSWMHSVKVLMGFVELATAMKFLSNADLVLRWGVFTRNVVLVIWLLIACAAVVYLLDAGGIAHGASLRRPSWWRVATALCTAVLAVYIARGLAGHRLGEFESFVPPPEGAVTSGTTSVHGELPWLVNDYAGGLTRARAEHRDLMIDFTGYTCTNCRWMEANMFPRPDVERELGRYVRVRLYTDGQGALYQRQQLMEQDKLGTVALPYYAIVDTLGAVKAQFLGMTRNADDFIQFLSEQQSSTAP